MLTPDHPTLTLWRAQKPFRHLTNSFVAERIAHASARVDRIASRPMTPSARDLAVSYLVRMSVNPCEERGALGEIVEMLTGGKL